eukprot:scaffold114268_cov30-Prasinocladus_malaysianus.AAC.1
MIQLGMCASQNGSNPPVSHRGLLNPSDRGSLAPVPLDGPGVHHSGWHPPLQAELKGHRPSPARNIDYPGARRQSAELKAA